MARCVVLLLVVSGCRFDSSGLSTVAVVDSGVGIDSVSHSDGVHLLDLQAADARDRDSGSQIDRGLGDHGPPLDAVPDSVPVDTILPDFGPPDSGTTTPINPVSLGQAFVATKVVCVDKSGKVYTTTTALADSAIIKLFDGQVTLAGAGQDTVSWVGGKPSVTVLYDINACDDEAPSGKAEWSSAGLLIRGATLDGSGDLVLAPGTTVTDINLLDILTNGTLQGEFVKPDDSLLYTYPQLVNPVNKAKELIVQLGT